MVTQKTYPCGLRLICDYEPNKNVAIFSINVASGSAFDLEDKDGIAHFYEHMFFKSTTTRTCEQLLTVLDSFGAEHNAYTSTEKTCYYGKVILDDIEKFVNILSDCFFNGVFAENEIETEKGVVCSEIDRYEDEFYDCCVEATSKELLKGTSYAHPILGTKESVQSITADDLRRYRQNNNCAKNVVIAFSGGVCQDLAEKLVEKYFLSHFDGECKPTIYFEKKPTTLTVQNKKIFVKKDTKQVYFLHATPTIRMDHEDFLKLKIASAMFGGLSSSRLFRRLREKEGLVYSVYSTVCSNTLSGFFDVFLSCIKENAEKAILAYKEEANKIINQGFSKDEVEQAKHLFVRNLILNNDSSQARTSAHVMSMIKQNKLYDIDEDIAKIEKLQADDVNEVFLKVLTSNNFVSCYLSNKDDIDVLNLLK